MVVNVCLSVIYVVFSDSLHFANKRVSQAHPFTRSPTAPLRHQSFRTRYTAPSALLRGLFCCIAEEMESNQQATTMSPAVQSSTSRAPAG